MTNEFFYKMDEFMSPQVDEFIKSIKWTSSF